MALAQNRLVAGVWRRLRTKVGVRFTRFVGVAIASLGATEVALTICNGVFEMTSTWAAIVSWFSGAVVSYLLSRWAWERKGKPDLLRETVPFWAISAAVLVILALANKLGYRSASWMGLGAHSVMHVIWVDFVWLVANFVTFITRFVIFHYVLFTDRTDRTGRADRPGRTAVPAGSEAPATSGGDAPAPRSPAPRA